MIEIEPVLDSDGPKIIELYKSEREVWPEGVKLVWHRFQQARRRSERWDKFTWNGKIIGAVHWAMRADNVRTVYDLVVVPEHRRKGVARALLDHVGAPTLLKTTHAHAFYEHLGFIRLETIDGKTMYFLDKELVSVPDGPWIMTYTGKIVNPMDLKPEDICIEDIAHALAFVNRYAGHTAKPISVAQHSVYVSRLCNDTPHEMQALLHDGSEAYLGDVTKWVKETPAFAAYREAEDRAQKVIFERFHCETVLHPVVERADRAMVLFEAPRGFGKAWNGLHLIERPGYEPLSKYELEQIGKWAPWPWRAAEEAFLVRFRMSNLRRQQHQQAS